MAKTKNIAARLVKRGDMIVPYDHKRIVHLVVCVRVAEMTTVVFKTIPALEPPDNFFGVQERVKVLIPNRRTGGSR